MARKRCAVCGDRCATNVRLGWKRESDGKTVNVCCLCAESGKVNAKSIDNYTTKDTLYDTSVLYVFSEVKSVFGGRVNRGTRTDYAHRIVQK